MARASTLRRDCLSLAESIAQSLGTIGPSATLGTVIPLLIGKSGNASWLLFLGIIVIYFFISHVIAFFATRCVSAGSLATYARLGLGRRAGIIAGWSYVVAMLFVVGSSAVSCAYYLDLNIIKYTGWPSTLGRGTALTSLVVLAAWWPARRDIRFSTKLMLVAELVAVGLILIILLLAVSRSGSVTDVPQLRLEETSFEKVRLGFVLAFMMLAGFESTTALSEETKGAAESIPRAMLTCLIPTGLLYIVSIYCLTYLGRRYNVALDQAALPFDALADVVGLRSLGWLSSAGIALSCYTCALAGLNAGSRILFSMAREGELGISFSETDVVTATPSRALNSLALVAWLIPCGLLLAGVSLSSGIDYLVQLASYGFLAAYACVCLAAPFFLARLKLLHGPQILVSAIALFAIGTALLLSVYPIAPAPYCYLPLSFAAMIVVGNLVSQRARGRRSVVAA